MMRSGRALRGRWARCFDRAGFCRAEGAGGRRLEVAGYSAGLANSHRWRRARTRMTQSRGAEA